MPLFRGWFEAGLIATLLASPASAALGNQVRRPDRAAPIAASVAIQLGERQAIVRHQWTVPRSAATSGPLKLRAPADSPGPFRGIHGTTLSPIGPSEWLVSLPDGPRNEFFITVTYTVPMPPAANDQPIPIRLAWLDQFETVETVVRIWSGIGTMGRRRPVGFQGPWMESPPSPVSDFPDLPALVLHGDGPQPPLSLLLRDEDRWESGGLEIERMWLQVMIESDGGRAYRVRGLIRPMRVHRVSVTLPATPNDVRFQVRLDGKRLEWSADSGKTVVTFLIHPDSVRPSRILELSYRQASDGSRWRTTLAPPQWGADVSLSSARWQVAWPDDRAAVPLAGSWQPAIQWTWTRGLLTANPRWSTPALSRWLSGESTSAVQDSTDGDCAFTAVGAPTEPVQLALIPRAAGVLTCSLAVIALATALALSRPSRRWAVVGTILAIGVVFAATHPAAAGALLVFAQPGILMLIPLAVAWFVIERRVGRNRAFQSIR